MLNSFFNEITALDFTIHCDVNLLHDRRFKTNLESLVIWIKEMTEDGKPVFDSVINSAGSIDLRLREETPLRVIKMMTNRIEQKMRQMQLEVA